MVTEPIFFDIETTGVKTNTDRIIEIAAYNPTSNKSFSHLINPNVPIPPEATAIHHISNDMVQNAPSFQEVGHLFLKFFPKDFILVAHNGDNFDKPFLEEELKRNGLSIPSWKFFDTLKWARKYRYDLPRHSLQFLREIYGISPNKAHRALDDVLVLYKVFSHMIDDLPISTAYDLLYKKTDLSRMPFGKYQGQRLEEVPKNYVQWLAKNGAFDKNENKNLQEALVKIGVLSLEI